MATFIVYEVQEWTEWRKYKYIVENAQDAEQANERVDNGEIEPIECGSYGDEDAGESGFATRIAADTCQCGCGVTHPEDDDEDGAWQAAADQLAEELP